MDKPEEVEFATLLFGGIIIMSLLALVVIALAVIYQRRLYSQQAQLHQIEINRQRDILESIIQSQEQERKRIAQDLHDEIGASLSTVKLFVGQVQYETSLNEAKNLTQQANGILKNILHDVRQIAQNLSPLVLQEVGLSNAIQLLLNRLQIAGLNVDYQIDIKDNILDNEKQLVLYRIIQEALGNIIKHAAASNLSFVMLQNGNILLLQIKDDGRGFIQSDNSDSTKLSMGLRSIHARASILNAHLHITSVIDKGTQVELSMPL